MLTSIFLGTLVGAVLGLTGAGGGILAVPALVVGMSWPMQQAAPVALIAVAGSAAIGAAEAFRRHLVRYKAAVLMALAGVPVTGLGIRVAQTLPQRVLLALFACVMLVVAARLFVQAQQAGREEDDEAKLARVNASTGRFSWTWPTAFLLAGIGGATGFMTGLLGVGGGFVIVPMLRRFTNVSMHGIVATSLLVIALVGTGSVITSIAHGTTFPLALTAYFTAATAIGMLIGRKASSRLSARHVQMGFAAVLVAVALGLLAKALAG